MTSYKMYTYQQ